MRVLIADDDPVPRLMLSRLVSAWGLDMVIVSNGIDAWEALQREDAPRLAIIDWMMPGMDGIEICRKVRSQNGSYAYILLLTARDNKQDLLDGLAAGADDYLTKPVGAAELKARLNVGRRILDLQDRLLFAATHDQLTGIGNRSAILQQLHAEWERRSREGSSLSILLADIDHFKRVNDTYGHSAGDTVLRKVALQMKTALRPYDLVGRYGGEEFLVVLPNCNLIQASDVAERMRQMVADCSIETSGQGTGFTVSISVGVASTNDLEHLDEASMLQAADSAMYEAKKLGRNRTIAASQCQQTRM